MVSERMCDSWRQTTSAPEEAMRAILACVLLPRSVRLWAFHERTCASVAGRLGASPLETGPRFGTGLVLLLSLGSWVLPSTFLVVWRVRLSSFFGVCRRRPRC